jgi:hypothetical protein
MLVFLIEEALKEARDEALRRGVVADVEQEPTFGSRKE